MEIVNETAATRKSQFTVKVSEDLSTLHRKNFIILDKSNTVKGGCSTLEIVEDSMEFCGLLEYFQIKKIQDNANKKVSCRFLLKDECLCSAVAETYQAAVEEAACAFLKTCMKKFYTIKVVNENRKYMLTITHKEIMEPVLQQSKNCRRNSGEKSPRRYSNSPELGILNENVSSELEDTNNALDKVSIAEMFSLQICCVFQDYLESGITGDMLFTSGFTEEQRLEIKKVAARADFKNEIKEVKNDDCKNELQFARVHKHKELFNTLIKSDGRTNKYLLYPPSCTVQGW